MRENEREDLVERILLLVSKGENDGLLGSSSEDGLDVEVLLEDLRVDAGSKNSKRVVSCSEGRKKGRDGTRRWKRDSLRSVSLGSTEVLESELLDGFDLHPDSRSILSSKVLDVSVNLLEDLFRSRRRSRVVRESSTLSETREREDEPWRQGSRLRLETERERWKLGYPPRGQRAFDQRESREQSWPLRKRVQGW